MSKSLTRDYPISDYSLGRMIRRLVSLTFWLLFALNYLYISRLLIVATNDKFRLGVAVTGLCLLAIIAVRKIVINHFLIFGTVCMISIILLSAWINNVPMVQFLAFIRIPVVAYLIYNLVCYYLNSKPLVEKVLRYMYIIAFMQLPVIIIQRVSYRWLPERFILNTALVDFGMGTFSGDTSMAFALTCLVVLLLFNHHVRNIVKRRWLTVSWLSLTVLFSNSQIQHITIALIWIVYILSHLRLKTVIIVITIVGFILGLLIALSLSGLMSFPYLQSTIAKTLKITKISDSNIDYSVFFSGGHSRAAAIAYYLHQPVKWIGDGPGSVYDTATGQRTVGGWGHFFTFYAEVGFIGLIVSILIFFAIAFPIHIGKLHLNLHVDSARILIFIAINVVALVKYPLGNSAIIFTYFVISISHSILSVSTPRAQEIQ